MEVVLTTLTGVLKSTNNPSLLQGLPGLPGLQSILIIIIIKYQKCNGMYLVIYLI